METKEPVNLQTSIWTDERTSVWIENTPGALTELAYAGAVELWPGPLADRLSDAAETYGTLPVDSVLKGFRERAGLPAPGTGLGGWAEQTSEATFGQWVSGLARLSSVLGDKALANRAVELIEGYSATLPADARTGMGIYGWEKLVCGLVDAAVYAGYDEALALLSRIVKAESFDRTRRVPSANDFAGAGPAFTPEWYTLPENLYRAYRAGKDEELAEFARLWHYDSYWNCFADHGTDSSPRTWDIPVWLHAYSHVNTLSSAAAAYDIYQDPRYLAVLQNAHEWLVETQCYATGGYGPCELTVPTDGSLGRALEWRNDTAEIVCGTWAAFKLCTALLKVTGEARYLSWPERLLYNGLGATNSVRPDGTSPYYADYRLGWATKVPYWAQWPCCSGTYVQAVAHVPDLVYQATADGVAVSLFVASRVTWYFGDRPVTLEQRTGVPESSRAVFNVVSADPVELTIRIRVPSWASLTRGSLNGERLIETPEGEQWVAVRRTWLPTDRLEVTFDCGLRAVPVDLYHPNRVAMAFGPVVLAQDAAWTTPFTAPVPWAMVEWESLLVRREEALNFSPVAPGTVRMPMGVFRPFSDFPEHHPYRMYHDLDHPRFI
jgi:hypothetical protein